MSVCLCGTVCWCGVVVGVGRAVSCLCAYMFVRKRVGSVRDKIKAVKLNPCPRKEFQSDMPCSSPNS